MDRNNFLNMDKRDANQFIYRIIPVEQLFKLFEREQNILVKPHKWEDPFENFIMRCPIQLSTGEISEVPVRRNIYGQCWTLQSHSDAMWRIYSPKGNAVRIRSTVRRVADSLSRAPGLRTEDSTFIGKVLYLRNEKLMVFAKTVFQGPKFPNARIFAQTLLVKRPAFRHEREIRLILLQHDGVMSKDDLFAYDMDPHYLVDQIMIDPRMPKPKGMALRQKIKDCTGFSKDIKLSLLYAPPPKFLIPFGFRVRTSG